MKAGEQSFTGRAQSVQGMDAGGMFRKRLALYGWCFRAAGKFKGQTAGQRLSREWLCLRSLDVDLEDNRDTLKDL